MLILLIIYLSIGFILANSMIIFNLITDNDLKDFIKEKKIKAIIRIILLIIEFTIIWPISVILLFIKVKKRIREVQEIWNREHFGT